MRHAPEREQESCHAFRKQPRLFILAGPGGVGKTTVQDAMLARFQKLVHVRGVWTRQYRPGEVNPDSDIVSRDEFQQLQFEAGLTCVGEVAGHLYATPIQNILAPLSMGFHAIRIVNMDGILALHRDLPELSSMITTIFLSASSKELRKRLEKRGDPVTYIERRLALAEKELGRAGECEWHIYADGTRREVVDEVERVLLHEMQGRLS